MFFPERRIIYPLNMSRSVAEILKKAEQLSVAEREELTDRLIESLARDISPDVQQAHMEELRRRIAELESGAAGVVPGDAALEQVRRLLHNG